MSLSASISTATSLRGRSLTRWRASGRLPLQATTRMAIVEELGWPAAQMLRYGKKGKKRIVKKDDAIYLLKCAPHCWRLYFYVRPESKGFVYVHAVCKKQDAEDAADTTVASKPSTSEPMVLLSRSPANLQKVIESPDYRLAWDNSVKFQLARHLLRLRRFRRWSQARVARAMGGSQPAVARIESGDENITLDTLERIIRALNGRFSVSVAPAEMHFPRFQPWWELIGGGVAATTPFDRWMVATRDDGATVPCDGRVGIALNDDGCDTA